MIYLFDIKSIYIVLPQAKYADPGQCNFIGKNSATSIGTYNTNQMV